MPTHDYFPYLNFFMQVLLLSVFVAFHGDPAWPAWDDMVAYQRGRVSNEPLGQRQDTGQGIKFFNFKERTAHLIRLFFYQDRVSLARHNIYSTRISIHLDNIYWKIDGQGQRSGFLKFTFHAGHAQQILKCPANFQMSSKFSKCSRKSCS